MLLFWSVPLSIFVQDEHLILANVFLECSAVGFVLSCRLKHPHCCHVRDLLLGAHLAQPGGGLQPPTRGHISLVCRSSG